MKIIILVSCLFVMLVGCGGVKNEKKIAPKESIRISRCIYLFTIKKHEYLINHQGGILHLVNCRECE
jgi:hypothetical protein